MRKGFLERAGRDRLGASSDSPSTSNQQQQDRSQERRAFDRGSSPSRGPRRGGRRGTWSDDRVGILPPPLAAAAAATADASTKTKAAPASDPFSSSVDTSVSESGIRSMSLSPETTANVIPNTETSGVVRPSVTPSNPIFQQQLLQSRKRPANSIEAEDGEPKTATQTVRIIEPTTTATPTLVTGNLSRPEMTGVTPPSIQSPPVPIVPPNKPQQQQRQPQVIPISKHVDRKSMSSGETVVTAASTISGSSARTTLSSASSSTKRQAPPNTQAGVQESSHKPQKSPAEPDVVVPKATLYTWLNRPPFRIVASAENYVTWDNGARPHEVKFTAMFIHPVTGECFLSMKYGDHTDQSCDVTGKGHAKIAWYSTKRLAEHGAAARAYDCLVEREHYQIGSTRTEPRMGTAEEPYLEARPLPSSDSIFLTPETLETIRSVMEAACGKEKAAAILAQQPKDSPSTMLLRPTDTSNNSNPTRQQPSQAAPPSRSQSLSNQRRQPPPPPPPRYDRQRGHANHHYPNPYQQRPPYRNHGGGAHRNFPPQQYAQPRAPYGYQPRPQQQNQQQYQQQNQQQYQQQRGRQPYPGDRNHQTWDRR